MQAYASALLQLQGAILTVWIDGLCDGAGSGKSSLMGAALGLMQQVEGPPVELCGKVRFQTPKTLHLKF